MYFWWCEMTWRGVFVFIIWLILLKFLPCTSNRSMNVLCCSVLHRFDSPALIDLFEISESFDMLGVAISVAYFLSSFRSYSDFANFSSFFES